MPSAGFSPSLLIATTPATAVRNTIQPSADIVPLTLKWRDVSQSAHMFQVVNQGGTPLFTIDKTGNLILSGATGSLASNRIQSHSSGAPYFPDGIFTIRLLAAADTSSYLDTGNGSNLFTFRVNSTTATGLYINRVGTATGPFLECYNGGIQFGIGPNGELRTANTAAATTLGSVTRRLPIYDTAGTLLGYAPVYGSIV